MVDGFTFAGAQRHYAPDVLIEPMHMIIGVEDVIIENEWMQLHIQMKVRANAKDVNYLVLDGIGLEELNVEGIGKICNYYYDGKKIQIWWSEKMKESEERWITIKYHVKKPVDGLYFVYPDDKYPQRGKYVATDHEPQRARLWLACVDEPMVRTTLEFVICAEKQHEVVANGVLVSKKEVKRKRDSIMVNEFRWQLDYPCPSYLICMAIGEYETVNDGFVTAEINGEVSKIPVGYIFPKNVYTPEDIIRTFSPTKDMLTWLQKKFQIVYPFPKHYQLVIPGKSGAMENMSLVSWDGRYIINEKLAKERKKVLDSVNVHEIGHTIFGDALVMRHFEHIWLKESWATYIECLWAEDHYSKEEFQYWLLNDMQLYLLETRDYQRPIVTRCYNHCEFLFDRHTYEGGSGRIHMLRMMLGDEAFWKGVHDYVKTFWKGIVETDDFRKCLEKASGRSLLRYFDRYFYEKGFPMLKGSFEYMANKNLVKISLEQTQSEDVFPLDIDIEVTTENSKVFCAKLAFLNSNERKIMVFINLDESKPAMVRLDPQGKTLFPIEMNMGEEILENTSKNASDIFNRVRASIQLLEIGTESAMSKLELNILQEAFYGVRIIVGKRLARKKTARSVRLLSEILRIEKDPSVIFELLNAVNYRDPVIRNVVIFLLQERNHELGYRSEARAWYVLGLQNEVQYFPMLIQAAEDSTRDDIYAYVRSGILEGIGAMHDSPDAFYFLERQLPYGAQPEYARPTVVSAYASAAKFQENKFFRDRAIDRLVELICDPDVRVARSAIFSLCDLQAKKLIGTLRSSLSRFAPEDIARIEKRLASLQISDEQESTKKLQCQFDELELKHRQLEDRLLQIEKERDLEKENKIKQIN